MKKKILASFFALIIIAAKSQADGLHINEFMASNSQTYADAAGEYEDWVEIYNSSAAPADLAGYYITDDLDNLTKQRLTITAGQLMVPPNGYLIIWGGGNTNLGPNHIDIGLSAGGEVLALVAPDGITVLDSYVFPAQKPDVSMGRTIDGAGEWKFLSPATPGASNNLSTAYIGFLAPPAFSTEGGIYAASFNLLLATTEPGATIIYSTDGSEPIGTSINGLAYRYKNTYPKDPGDPIGSFLYDTVKTVAYNDPILIKDRSGEANVVSLKSSTYDENPSAYTPKVPVRKAQTIRAMAIKAGYLSSNIVTHTYFPASVGGLSRYTLPVVSLSVPENYLFNWDTGVYNAGNAFELWRTFLPTAPADGGSYANYQLDTEYPLSMEYFAAGSGQRLVQRNAGFRIHGSYSAALPQKSLRIYFRSEYGGSDLGYPIFSSQANTDFKRLIIRNSGNEGSSKPKATYLRDMSLQTLVKRLNFDTQDAQPCITYINGEYWGLHQVRERQDRFYFEMKYGIKEGELDLLENNAEVEEGDISGYNAMYQYIASQNMADPLVYDSILKLMDTDNFIDYQAAEIFFGNTDWPQNNIRYYRKRVPFNASAPKGQDGRWRWAMYDVDFGFGFIYSETATHNNLNRATNAAGSYPWATLLLRRLLLNPLFRQQFINRFADLLNSTFLPTNTASKINYYRQMIGPEMPDQIERWRVPASVEGWATAVNQMVDYGNLRPEEQRKHIAQKFAIAAQHNITVNVNNDAQGIVKVNTIKIDSTTDGIGHHPYPWTGIYFDKIPVQLVAIASPGCKFLRWEGDTSLTNDTLVIDIRKSTSVTAVFEQDALASQQIVHYWHFNNIASGSLDVLQADSSVNGSAVITYPGSGAGYLDATGEAEGSALNAQYGQPAGKALRIRNPSDTRYLQFSAPAIGFKDLKISYSAQRTNRGAQYQRIRYSVTAATNWLLLQDSLPVNEVFELQSFDLSGLPDVNDNGNLAIRIDFFGSNAAGTSGNNRIDNLLITGLATTFACTVGNWTGTVDTDWFNPSNWCGGIPSASSSVTIKAGLPNYPVLLSTPSIIVKSLKLEAGASLSLLPSAVLEVSGGQCVVQGNLQLAANAKLDVK